MKIFISLLFLVFSTSAFSHCPLKFDSYNLCADLEWVEGPFDGTPSKFKIRFWEKGDHNHIGVSPAADINIYAWMIMHNGHSHGGPKMTWTEVSPGVFEVNDARFFMGGMHGYWEVRIDLIENGTTVNMAAKKVDFDGNGSGHDHDHK